MNKVRKIYISLGLLATLMLIINPMLIARQSNSTGLGSNIQELGAFLIANAIALLAVILPLVVSQSLRALRAAQGGIGVLWFIQAILLLLLLNNHEQPAGTGGPYADWGSLYTGLVLWTASLIIIGLPLLGMLIGFVIPVRRSAKS